MSCAHEVTFRGAQRTAVVDRFDVDYETNAAWLEWHFEDLTPDEHNALNITAEEDSAITEYLLTVEPCED